MNNVVWAIVVDVVNLICWAAISIHFGRWWLMLFSILTMVTVEEKVCINGLHWKR